MRKKGYWNIMCNPRKLTVVGSGIIKGINPNKILYKKGRKI